MVWFPFALTSLACVCDVRRREAPDWISLVLALGALAAWSGGLSPVGLGGMLLGGGAALAISASLFFAGGLGGADVKLLTALGLWFGPAMLAIGLWTALAGAVLAIAAGLRGHRDYAYIPAIWLGLAVHLAWPDLLWRVAGPL